MSMRTWVEAMLRYGITEPSLVAWARRNNAEDAVCGALDEISDADLRKWERSLVHDAEADREDELENREVARLQRQAERRAFYDSREWRTVRYRALRRSKGCCECCGARGGRTNPLQVDHIQPRSRFPDLALDLDNLQVLCRLCNLGKGSRDATDWREVRGA